MKASDIIHAMVASLKYNRNTVYIMEVCHRIIKRIDESYNFRSITADDMPVDNQTIERIEDDVNNIYGTLVMLYGDYGTSPRSGWIEGDSIKKEIISTLTKTINDLANIYMYEYLEDMKNESNESN